MNMNERTLEYAQEQLKKASAARNGEQAARRKRGSAA